VAIDEQRPGRVRSYFGRTFASLAIRDYRLLLSGNIITQFGQWFQQIGMNWLVFIVTGNAFTMGTLAAWRGIITLFLSPFAGVWADRVDRRSLVILFTFISALEATALAILVYTGGIVPGTGTVDSMLSGTVLEFAVTSGLTRAWVFFIFAFIDGIVESLTGPTRQAFVYDVAGRDQVANAIALNASIGNFARATGPNIAGAVIGFFGVHWAFIIRATSIWTALNFTMRIKPKPRMQGRGERRETTFRALLEGFNYVIHDRLIFGLLLAEMTLPFLVYPYLQFLPVFASEVLGGDARTYGALASGFAIGAIPGAFIIASLGNFRRRGLVMVLAAIVYMTGVLLFTRTTVFLVAWAFLILAGVFGVMTQTLVQSLIQLNVRTDVRARTLGLYTMGNSALRPLGTLGMGSAIAILGPQNGVALFLVAGMAVLALIVLAVPEIRRA
jgi:MFS family permease